MKSEVGVGLHALVEVDDVQYVEQLPLVLMQPLHLHVKEGVGVEDDAALPGHPGRRRPSYCPLDLPQAGEHARVVPVLLQLLEGVGLEQVFVLAAAVADQGVQLRVALAEPAAVVNAVGDVGKLVGGAGIASWKSPASECRSGGRTRR